MRPRPNILAEVADRRIEGDEAYRIGLAQFLDAFYMNPERRQGMIDAEPPPTGSNLNDAMFGAIAEHLARRWDLVIPAWTNDGFRFLHRPYFATPIEALKATLLAQSPIAFRRRMIFVEHEPTAASPHARDPQTVSGPRVKSCTGVTPLHGSIT